MAFDERIPTLATIADDLAAKPGDRIGAIDVLGRVGLGPAVTVEDVRVRLIKQNDYIRKTLGDKAPALLAELRKLCA
jgi:hypothetical protein